MLDFEYEDLVPDTSMTHMHNAQKLGAMCAKVLFNQINGGVFQPFEQVWTTNGEMLLDGMCYLHCTR